MATVLKTLDRVTYDQGALLEGDAFSILSGSPHILRSPEFALADGAIDCSRTYEPEMTYTQRYWEMQSFEPSEAPELCLFDVKSSVGGHLRQGYVSTPRQRQHVTFYLGLCAANPGYVELIPNYHQKQMDPDAEVLQAEDRALSVVNKPRHQRLPPKAYGGLDPSGSPYRMPIALLTQAIASVRECALGRGSYTNPWTQVTFAAWKPYTTRDIRWMRPLDGTTQLTAYTCAMEILQASKRAGCMAFNFMGLAPRVADFWLDNVTVQHKVDSRPRKTGGALRSVAIARKGHYYFNELERFDFLMQYFETAAKPPRRFCFFIPEKVIPDHFYVTRDVVASFDLPEFRLYRMEMDANLEWVMHIKQIIVDNPKPRREGMRPRRGKEDLVPREEEKDVDLLLYREPLCEGGRGQHEYHDAMTRGHWRFFYGVMAEGRGLLVVLSRNNPIGDWGYCRYHWTPEDQEAFASSHTPRPAYALPAQVAVVPICYYARHQPTGHAGPNLTAAEFRRLNSSALRRLVVWDIGGPDVRGAQPLLAIVPSEDIQPTSLQTESLTANVGKNKNAGEWDVYNPNVSDVLNTGRYQSEYGIAAGPRVYGSYDWATMWELLDAFTGMATVEHPRSFHRDPVLYRHTLQIVHERLAQEHREGQQVEGGEGEGANKVTEGED